MKAVFEKAFQGKNIEPCLTVTNKEKIELFEDETSKTTFVKTQENNPVHFTIINEGQTTVYLLAVDVCVLDSKDPSRCDFLFSEAKRICFVEFKKSKLNRKKKNKSDAYKQLKSVISRFLNDAIFSDFELEAYVAVGRLDLIYPRKTASSQDQMTEFLTEYRTNLYEGNEVKLSA
jgi:hypothetical protein